MPKKKNPPSGFGLVMKEQQEIFARQGRRIPLSQMKDIADPIWKAMPAEQKAIYNQRAKECKKEERNTTERLASDGMPLSYYAQKNDEEDLQDRQMVLDIQEFINANAGDTDYFKRYAANQDIYLMSFNIMCYVPEDDRQAEQYIPLEIGIANYSVQRGIIRTYHKFINPGPVPFSYRGDAMRHSEATHKIPYTGLENAEGDYNQLWREVCQFLNLQRNASEVVPIFCTNENIDQTYGCIKWISWQAGLRNVPDAVKVWDLGYYLHQMRSAAGSPLPSHLIANDVLSKNTFDYCSNTRCSYHDGDSEQETPNCALGVVQRLCYLLSDSLCGVFDIAATTKHLPVRAIETKGYEVTRVPLPKMKGFKDEVARTIREERNDSSRNYGLDTFDDDDDGSSSVLSLSTISTNSGISRYSSASSVTSAMSQLRMSAPTVAPGQGLGRGRASRR